MEAIVNFTLSAMFFTALDIFWLKKVITFTRPSHLCQTFNGLLYRTKMAHEPQFAHHWPK